MLTVIIVIHLMIVSAMIGLVLLQKSEGGGLGMGGGGGGFLTSRGTSNVLTRTTAILAAVFFATSLPRRKRPTRAGRGARPAASGDASRRAFRSGGTASAAVEIEVSTEEAGTPGLFGFWCVGRLVESRTGG
ncbi:MAG: preprotein translocase subunit SecG [Bradyrhizobium sp.]|nr:preprotein translocase subunit SecG [Bradyrhizobium sp.]